MEEVLLHLLLGMTKDHWPCPNCCISMDDLKELERSTELAPKMQIYLERLKVQKKRGEIKVEQWMWHPQQPPYVWKNQFQARVRTCMNMATESGTRCAWE